MHTHYISPTHSLFGSGACEPFCWLVHCGCSHKTVCVNHSWERTAEAQLNHGPSGYGKQPSSAAREWDAVMGGGPLSLDCHLGARWNAGFDSVLTHHMHKHHFVVEFPGLQKRGRTSSETARMQLNLFASLWPCAYLPCSHRLQQHAGGQGQLTPTPAQDWCSTPELHAAWIGTETAGQLLVRSGG